MRSKDFDHCSNLFLKFFQKKFLFYNITPKTTTLPNFKIVIGLTWLSDNSLSVK